MLLDDGINERLVECTEDDRVTADSADAAFALGAQNLLSQKSGVVKANTTFMTGNIQKMAEAMWNAWQKRKSGGLSKADTRAAAVLFCTWSSYIGGGACGAATAAAKTFHWSITPVALLYATGMASMQIEPGKPKPKPPATSKPSEGDQVAPVQATPNAMVIEIAPAQ